MVHFARRLWPLGLLLLPAAACGPEDATGLGTAAADPSPSCAVDDSAFPGLTATRSGVGTVLQVRWDPADGEAGEAAVTFVDSVGQARRAAVGPEGTALLVGLRQETEVAWRAEASQAGSTICSTERRTRTGSLPAGLPEYHFERPTNGAVSPGFLSLPVMTADQRMVIVYDTGGHVVWAWSVPEDTPSDVALFRADFDREGQGIVLNIPATPAVEGRILRVPWDGGPPASVLIPTMHRDFVQLPGGGATLAWEAREDETDGVVVGDLIVEFTWDGELEEVWSSFEGLHSPYESAPPVDSLPPGASEWTHTNGLFLDPDADAWLVSLPLFNAIASVDRQSGELLWMLENDHGSFDWQGEEPAVEAPHSVEAVNGGVLVFNRAIGTTQCATAVEVALDPENGVATEAWRYTSDPCLVVPLLGSARRLPDGNTAISWSTAGQVDIVGPEEASRWRLRLDLGAAFGFVDFRADPTAAL